MKIVFQIDGGIGKSVAATAVCKAIKKQHPKDELIVITGYPEVFLCNPHVNRVYDFNNMNYFYQDHVENQKIKALIHNPYVETDFIMGNGHLIKGSNHNHPIADTRETDKRGLGIVTNSGRHPRVHSKGLE